MFARVNRITFANSFSLDSLGFGKLIIVSGIRDFSLGCPKSFKQTYFPRATLSFTDPPLELIAGHCIASTGGPFVLCLN